MATPTHPSKPVDATLSALSNQRRRYALRCLDAFEKPAAVADLAREVLACEEGMTVTDVTDEKTKRVHRSLYHVHIPKLEEANLVQYDTTQRIVTLSEETGELIQRWECLAVEHPERAVSSST